MIAVFDASVLVKVFLKEEFTPIALQLAKTAEILLAPDIVRIEVVSAITRAARNTHITKEVAEQTITKWEQFQKLSNLKFTPFNDLLSDAQSLSLQLRHPVIDCLYLALAIRSRVPLLTADDPLCRASQPQNYDVRHVAACFASDQDDTKH